MRSILILSFPFRYLSDSTILCSENRHDAPHPAAFSEQRDALQAHVSSCGTPAFGVVALWAKREVPTVEYDSACLSSKTQLGTAPLRPRDKSGEKCGL